MASCVQHTLEINCGFACCAIRELTPKTNGPKEIDTQQRASEFKLFSEYTNYGIDERTSIIMAKMAPFSTGTVLSYCNHLRKSGTLRRQGVVMRKPFQLPTGKVYHSTKNWLYPSILKVFTYLEEKSYPPSSSRN